MTIGDLRGAAQTVVRTLSIAFVNRPESRSSRPQAAAASPVIEGRPPLPRDRQSRRRELSPEARAALARNLGEVRAVRATEAMAKMKTTARP